MPSPNERFDRASNSAPYKPQSRALNPLDVVIAPGWNVRNANSAESKDHIAALKLAIITNGYDQTKPISVKYDRVTGVSTLVDGECRLTACQQIRNEGQEIWIPAVVTDGDEAQLTVESIAGNAGKQLTQWEIGEGCRRLLRFGKTTEWIAASICKSLRYVTDAIALSNVSLEAKSMMASGQVTPARVLQEVHEHGDEAVEVLKEAVAASVEPAAIEPQATAKPAKKVKPTKAKPLARKKAPSAKVVSVESALKLADDLARHTIKDDWTFEQLEKQAQAYLQARGIEI